MHSSTVGAFPGSYSKTRDTFRPRIGQSATTRTGLGTVAFVDDFKHSLMPTGFILQELLEHIPASVVHGFRHVRFRQFATAHIAYDYISVLLSYTVRRYMQFVFAPIFNFCVYRFHALLVLCALSCSKLIFKATIPAIITDFSPITQVSEILKPKINSYGFIGCLFYVFRFRGETNIPMTLGVLNKTSSFKRFVEFSVLPKPIFSFLKSNAVTLKLNSAFNKRDPAQSFFTATEFRTFFKLVSRLSKLLANRVTRVTMHHKFFANFLGCIYKVKMRRPKVHTGTLIFNTKVPDNIGFPSLNTQRFDMAFVFDSVSVCKYHGFRQLFTCIFRCLGAVCFSRSYPHFNYIPRINQQQEDGLIAPA